MSIDLSQIRYEVHQKKKKKGLTKAVSAEDNFQMAALQPACHTKKFKNEYFLCIRTKYDSNLICHCGKKNVERPVSRLQMTIVPMCNPECFGFIPEEGFNPIELPMVTLRLKKI